MELDHPSYPSLHPSHTAASLYNHHTQLRLSTIILHSCVSLPLSHHLSCRPAGPTPIVASTVDFMAGEQIHKGGYTYDPDSSIPRRIKFKETNVGSAPSLWGVYHPHHSITYLVDPHHPITYLVDPLIPSLILPTLSSHHLSWPPSSPHLQSSNFWLVSLLPLSTHPFNHSHCTLQPQFSNHPVICVSSQQQ